MANRLYQVRFPLHEVSEWVNSVNLDDFVVSVVPLDETYEERKRHGDGSRGPMAVIFLRVPVNHPWALARPPRQLSRI